MSSWKKRKEEQGLDVLTRWVETILNGIVRVSLIKKMRNKQRPEKLKHQKESVLWVEGTAAVQTQAYRWEHVWCSENTKKAAKAGEEEVKGRIDERRLES